jgi:hypothetical protein
MTTTEAQEIWSNALHYLKATTTQATVEQWLQGSEVAAADGDQLTIRVVKKEALPWLENRLRKPILNALALTGHPLQVVFVCPVPPLSAAPEPAPATATDLSPPPATNGNGAKPARGRRKGKAQEEGGGKTSKKTSEASSRFKGFATPKENWSKLPHEMIEAMPFVETVGELKVILYILRHTWGFQDEDKKITLDEFEHGRRRRNGSRIDNGLGLTRPTIIDGLKRAEEHGFIAVEVDTSDSARTKKYYSLVMEEG